MKMYQIKVTEFYYENEKGPDVHYKGRFETEEAALMEVYRMVIEELNRLNRNEEGIKTARVFLADLDGDHAAIIRMWDKEDYLDVAYYDIVEVPEERVLTRNLETAIKDSAQIAEQQNTSVHRKHRKEIEN